MHLKNSNKQYSLDIWSNIIREGNIHKMTDYLFAHAEFKTVSHMIDDMQHLDSQYRL